MNSVLTNWKTTLAGAAAILTALGDIASHLSAGSVGSGAIETDIVTILAGLGLVATNPVDRVRPPKSRATARRALTASEARSVVAVSAGDRLCVA